jgi:hypothetical protein
MMLRLHVPILDEMDMWSLVGKNPKETWVLEKHNTKASLWELKKIVKIMLFSIGTVSTLLAISSIWIKIKPNEKAKQHRIGANRMEFQNVYVLQYVKSFTFYYINCVYPRIWVSRVYIQELRW